MRHRGLRGTARRIAWIALALASVSMWQASSLHGVAAVPATSVATLSIVSTTDVHGFVFPREDRGGVAWLGGYLRNLRANRAQDGGAVVLVDAGDTFQGGIESDLTEGALVVDAYNALGYAAAAIGNHEFEFGAVDRDGARQDRSGDPRGALKARAAQAAFPILAANLIDLSTGRPVEWANVRPSAIVEASGTKVGIVGVMTIDALRATLPVNVHGLGVAPLAPAIVTEATALRAAGATVVLVVAHAGGGCTSFNDAFDLSSCDESAEIFQVARQLPAGLVDAIAAGHTHDGIAQMVNGIPIIQAYSGGRAFARVDLTIDRTTRRAVNARPFAPRELCGYQDLATLRCGVAGQFPAARYEGQLVAADPEVDRAMAPELAHVRRLQAAPLGVTVESTIRRGGDTESPLGNLFADALREATGADVGINNNVRGGLRGDLQGGSLTLGDLFDVFPFDNRLVTLALTGAELKRLVADEMLRNRRGALGISGVLVRASCAGDRPDIALARPSGRPVLAEDRLIVATMDTLAAGAVFGSAPSAANLVVSETAPILREVVEDWLRQRGGQIRATDFVDAEQARWEWPDPPKAGCMTR